MRSLQKKPKIDEFLKGHRYQNFKMYSIDFTNIVVSWKYNKICVLLYSATKLEIPSNNLKRARN